MKIRVKNGNSKYNIILKREIIGELNLHVSPFLDNNQVVIIIDKKVNKLYGEKISSQFSEEVLLIEVVANENNKTLKMTEEIIKKMVDKNINRKATIISFGGGMIGDLAGFVASIYLRGINYIQIPTTLLSQVDSSVGSKVAVNLNDYKNQVGSFYAPKVVLIDPVMLDSLTKREFNNGMAEVIKTAITLDKNLFDNLENLSIDEIVYRCCKIKARVTWLDFKEKNLRKKLNFGHTIGHAIESHYKFKKYKHGEAVSIGMFRICLKYSSEDITRKLVEKLNIYNLPVVDTVSNEDLFKMIKKDKKSNGEDIDITIIEKIGKSKIKSVKITDLKG